MTEREIEEKFKGMLNDFENSLRDDYILQDDLKDFSLDVNWDICGIKGYQRFNKGDYIFRFGEELDNPDLTLEIKDTDIALKLLDGEIDNFSYQLYKRKFKLYFIDSWEKIETKEGIKKTKVMKFILNARYSKGNFYHPFSLTRIPIFREIAEKWYDPETANGTYIPINKSLGTYDDQVLPVKVLEYFINKSNHFLLFHSCGCRVVHECKDHDMTLGCMYMDDDVVNFEEVFPKITHAHLGTREEALERVKLAYENGLVAVIGRLKLESESMGIQDRGKFMTVCFCCPCCCINGKFRYGTSELQNILERIEGVSVIVDEDLCIGCGECLEVCVFSGMDIIESTAKVNQSRCVGCGRCERVCLNGAISISLDDPKRLDEFFSRIEANVDVS